MNIPFSIIYFKIKKQSRGKNKLWINKTTEKNKYVYITYALILATLNFPEALFWHTTYWITNISQINIDLDRKTAMAPNSGLLYGFLNWVENELWVNLAK